jgi:hypothetical protein
LGIPWFRQIRTPKETLNINRDRLKKDSVYEVERSLFIAGNFESNLHEKAEYAKQGTGRRSGS